MTVDTSARSSGSGNKLEKDTDTCQCTEGGCLRVLEREVVYVSLCVWA